MAPRSRATGRMPAGPARPAGPSPRQREAIRAVVQPVVAGAGYDLEELTVSRAGRRYLVRATVDRDGGVGLDDVAEVSRAVSAALDDAESAGGELVAGGYQLEVSSPGVDRPLTEPRHWRRNRGRLVKVAVAGQQIAARVMDADGTGVVFGPDPVRHVPYGQLGPGRVQVELHRVGESAGEDGPAGDLDSAGGVDDDDFRNMFDGDGFTRDDGVDGRPGTQGGPAGAGTPGPGSVEDKEREDEER